MDRLGRLFITIGGFLTGSKTKRNNPTTETQEVTNNPSEKNAKALEARKFDPSEWEPVNDLPPYQEHEQNALRSAPTPELATTSAVEPTNLCIKEATSAPVAWIQHPSEPSFLICGRCYVDHIANTSLNKEFVLFRPVDRKRRFCQFKRLDMTLRVWNQAVSEGSMEKFISHIIWARTVRDCPKSSSRAPGDIWYASADFPEFTVCEECYEDRIASTGFATHFERQVRQSKTYCKAHCRYVTRLLKMDSTLPSSWDEFVTKTKERFNLPACPLHELKPGKLAKKATWYQCFVVSQPYFFCGACYHSFFVGTRAENDFTRVEELPKGGRCMATSRFRAVITAAEEKDDYHLLYNALNEGAEWPECEPKGVSNTTWFTFPGNVHRSYAICGRCYHGNLKPQGMGDYFIPKTDVRKGENVVCWRNYYHPASVRHGEMLSEALIFGDPSRLYEFINKHPKRQGCRGAKTGRGANQRWWGWDKMRICDACYHGGSMTQKSIVKKFQLRGERDPMERKCDLASHSLRWLFMERDVTKLLEYADSRAST
ncbi:hypothetical protein V2G26_006335 [Clonostachys chloroleuca]